MKEAGWIDRRGIFSAKGVERGGGPHSADAVRNDGRFLESRYLASLGMTRLGYRLAGWDAWNEAGDG